MTDYETVRIYSVGSRMVGKLYITVSSERVGLQNEVLACLENPERNVIRKGVRSNAGTLMIEAVEKEKNGSIQIDYEKRKIGFYDKDFVGMCKGMIRQYAHGDFMPGVVYRIKGIRQENTVIFDFRKAVRRQVKGRPAIKKAKRSRTKMTPKSSPLPGYELL